MLLDAASQGLGIALVSRLLSARVREQGLLVALSAREVRGPNWSWLVHRDSEGDALTRSFCDWLLARLEAAAAVAD